MADKNVYFFAEDQAEGADKTKDLLGGKGLGLAKMAAAGVAVPPGFTITAEVCHYFMENGNYPQGLQQEVTDNVERLEKTMKAGLGDPENPLLVSVRSGAAVSMPGMMDTILNLGINDDVVNGLARKTENERFAWDSYRRFIQMFGNVAMGISGEKFEEAMDAQKADFAKRQKMDEKEVQDVDLTTEDLKQLVGSFKEIYKESTGDDFPQEPKKQLWRAIDAVFESWNNPRAVSYRRMNDIAGLLGTAVNVQTMVFGNMGEDSATGVAFSRNPATGEKKFYGEYLPNAQGEDVVAGIRTPLELSVQSSKEWAERNDVSEERRKERYPSLEEYMSEAYEQLVEYSQKLEEYYKDMQDMEFTIQSGQVYMLQTRTGKRTAPAAVKIAVDMVEEGLINDNEALLRVEPRQVAQLLHPMFIEEEREKANVLGRGLNASPGAAVGTVVFFSDRAAELHKEGQQVVLVRTETSPEDIEGMEAAEGVLTSRGGATSHAAVVARGMGKPCVVGCGELSINYKDNSATLGGKKITEGDVISIDGTSGEILEGEIPTREPELTGNFGRIMEWADKVRKLGVRTNADTPADARRANEFGAEGVGLCRTEHMFFGEERIGWFRRLIIEAPKVRNLERRMKDAKDEKKASLQKQHEQHKKILDEALEKLMPMQQGDFEEIFKAMEGKPVCVRLLDPPLHEFLPHGEDEIKALAKRMDLDEQEVRNTIESMAEANPMLGHRGCRLGISYPEITEMQLEAIMRAGISVRDGGLETVPEIMFPLVGNVEELRFLNKKAHEVYDRVKKDTGKELPFKLGTMIEVPRAGLTADEIAPEADFFSFGTNDLTQMTCGFSRDDSASFMGDYLELGIYEKDPFQVLDQRGVGKLLKLTVNDARETNKNIKLGICGEHGGEPNTIAFCNDVGLDYVSCSPFRVPVARIAAAQAVLQ
jgi:pyruvate,orthophosphate dikinase